MLANPIAQMRKAHEVLTELVYEPRTLERGYANRLLRIDISKNTIEIQPVTQQMKDLWIGGKGFDLWLMLQEIHAGTKWDSPENPICMSSGPLGGTTSFPGSGKTLVTSISPTTSSVMDCNVGGYFGPYLKFAGFDALVLVGNAQEEVMVYIDGVHHRITIEKAPMEGPDSHVLSEQFTEMYADSEADKRNISVVSSGRGAQYGRLGVLNFSFWDWRRGVARIKQAGRGGLGTVFRHKKIKALVIKNQEIVRPWRVSENKAAALYTSQLQSAPKSIDREAVKDIISKWHANPESVIAMLEEVQKKERFISQQAVEEISLKTGVSQAQLYHIVTFYKGFSLAPRGENGIEVCMGAACHAKGSQKILEVLENTLDIKSGQTTTDGKFTLESVACLGCCNVAPVIKIGEEIIDNVQTKDIPKIIETYRSKEKHSPAVASAPKAQAPAPAVHPKEMRVALRNQGHIHPEKIEDYIQRGGYASLQKALTMTPDGIIREVLSSGLRGRGGGGFPTGLKWLACQKATQEKKDCYLVCNDTERSILEVDPHTVLEGLLIGAYALGAKEGFVYVRKEYPLAAERMQKAIAAAKEKGFLGQKILGKDFSFDVHVQRGAGSFVCGESSALLSFLGGKVGEPRSKYVHSAEAGFRNKPTVVNNAETWANIPVILEKGASWFASLGKKSETENPWEGASGTKVFSLGGAIAKPGLVEVPMGTSLREIIFEVGGGLPKGAKFKGVHVGGPSGGCLSADQLDTSADYDSLKKALAMMGSASLVVLDQNTCMVDTARSFIEFLSKESCGKCTACREGLQILKKILTEIVEGKGTPEDLVLLAEVAESVQETSLCQLGGTAPNPVLSTLKYFQDEYKEHIEKKKCRAGVCKELVCYHISLKCVGCTVCAKACPTQAISGEAKKLHKIDLSKCTKCGACRKACKFEAVEVM